jgi:AcrR family transcriptional regulator
MVDKAVDTRGRLVDAAVDLFSAQGYDATSMRAIAEKVGVTKPALYHYFASKDDLLLAAVRPMQQAVQRLLDTSADGRLSPEQFLESYFDTVMEHKQLAMWLSGDSTARSRPVLAEIGWRQQEALVELLRGDDSSFEREIKVACALGALQVGIIMFAANGGLEQARGGILRSVIGILEGQS